MPWHVYRGQKITRESQFSPSSMWILGLELSFSGLAVRRSQLSHLPGLIYLNWFEYLCLLPLRRAAWLLCMVVCVCATLLCPYALATAHIRRSDSLGCLSFLATFFETVSYYFYEVTMSFQGFPCLYFPSPWKRAGIADACHCVQLRVGSGRLNSGPQVFEKRQLPWPSPQCSSRAPVGFQCCRLNPGSTACRQANSLWLSCTPSPAFVNWGFLFVCFLWRY